MGLRQFSVLASSLFGASGVVGGAFGAHALAHSWPEKANLLKTAVQYQLLHAVALLALSTVISNPISKPIRVAVFSMSAGTFLFSMSLALMAILDWRWLGPVTPIGGSLLIIGWISLAFHRVAT